MSELESIVSELSHVRNLLVKKDDDLKEFKTLARVLLNAYKGTLIKGGASLASDRTTNHLIALAEDMLNVQ